MKAKFFFPLTRLALIASILSFLLRPFLPSPAGEWILFLSGSLFFLSVQPLISKNYRLSVYILTGLGLLLFIVYREPLSVLVEGVPYMLNLVVLLAVMQLFTVPITVGQYGQHMGTVLLSGIRRESTLYGVSQLIMTLFSCFTSLGAVVVVLRLLEDSIKNAVRDFQHFASCAISRGYLGAILWSPAGITVLMVSDITGLQWADFFPWCLLLSILGIFLSVFYEYPGKKARQMLDTSSYPPFTPDQLKLARRKLVHIILVALSMIIGVNVFEDLLSVSSTHSIVITGVLIFLIWVVLLNLKGTKKRETAAAMGQYWRVGLSRSFDLGALFIAMGIFTKALLLSPLMVSIGAGLSGFFSTGILPLLVFPLIIMGLGLFGVHPFISVTLIGNILLFCGGSIPMLPAAISLCFGANVSYMTSPLAGVTLALGKTMGCSSLYVSRNNMVFSLIYYVICAVIIVFLCLVPV